MKPTKINWTTLKQNREKCRICNGTYRLQVHHIDGNHHNDNLDNLTILCCHCHGKQHTNKWIKGPKCICLSCNHSWISRKVKPNICPKCKSYKWNEAKQ